MKIELHSHAWTEVISDFCQNLFLPQSSTIKWVRCLSTKWAPTSCKYRVITLLIGVIARVTHLFWAIIWLITPFFTNVGAHSWMAVSGRYQRMLRMPRAQTVLGSIESFTQNGSEVQGWWNLGLIFSTGFPWSRCFAQMIRLMKSYYVYQFVISFSTKIVGWTQGEECKQINLYAKKKWRSWESHVFFSPSGVLLGRCCCVSTVFQAPTQLVLFFCHESRVNDHEISMKFHPEKGGRWGTSLPHTLNGTGIFAYIYHLGVSLNGGTPKTP